LQERVEGGDPRRRVGDGFVRHRRPAFDVLQLNEPLQIGKHVVES
jgi:hypothetical protein